MHYLIFGAFVIVGFLVIRRLDVLIDRYSRRDYE